MNAKAYYNEIDPYAAQWLRNLIAAGLICAGDVDERSVVDVRPSDLSGYTQCHFFAGIGIWSAALQRSGWPDSRPVWTGSCPCQPFSAAGSGAGFDDERHLWPHWHWLISQCRPGIVFGEQVASPDGLKWFDLVSSDFEGTGYTGWVADLCSAGIGAPHIRQRLYWLAIANDAERRADFTGGHIGDRQNTGRSQGASDVEGCGGTDELANAALGRFAEQRSAMESRDIRHANSGRNTSSVMAYADGGDASAERKQRGGQHGQQPADDVSSREGYFGIGHNSAYELERPGPVNGFWRDADWIFCRDGKWRPIGPGSFPLAHGLPAGMVKLGSELSGLAKLAGLDGKSLARAKAYRTGALKGFGNAVNDELTTEFIIAATQAIETERVES